MLDVSVVVPFYNRSSFLERLLDSVLNQTEEPKKVYLVDNGSSSEEVIKLLSIINKEKYSTIDIVYTSTIDKGNANYARNLGYILSDTQYVAFLDSDDWWNKDHLKKSIDTLSQSDKSGIYSGAIVHTKDGQHINKSIDVNNFENPFELILSPVGYLAQTSSYIIDKKSIGMDVLWDENLKRHQDFDYFAAIFYNTDGWCYCSEANVNIDWAEGGTGKNIDFESLVFFYEKWEALIPNLIKKHYLRGTYMNIYDLKADLKYKYYYRNKINPSKNNFSRELLHIHSRMLIGNTLDFFKLKHFIKKLLK